MPPPVYHILQTVWVTTSFVALHRWKDAPAHTKYLASPHRHQFHVRAEIEVYHDDRELEFHDLKTGIDSLIVMWLHSPKDEWDIDQSCERIATRLIDWLRTTYPGRPSYAVSVSEDGENGATISLVSGEWPNQ